MTNARFSRFVAATGYVTVAERAPDPEDFPGVPPEDLKAGSLVFTPPAAPVDLREHYQWWRYVPGADSDGNVLSSTPSISNDSARSTSPGSTLASGTSSRGK